MEKRDDLSFAHLANEPVSSSDSVVLCDSTYAWEAMRAQWVARRPTQQKMTSPQNSKQLAAKLVSGGTISTPVPLDEVIACLLVRWEEESDEA